MPTGLNTTFGIGLEAKYAEYKVPTRWLEIESSTLARKQDYLSPRPLRGRPGVPSSRHVSTTVAVEGAVVMEVPNKGLGLILNMLHGETVEAEKIGGGKAYEQEHKIGVTAPNGKSLSVQMNKPTAVEDEVFNYFGCKVTEATFSCDTSGALKLSCDVMGGEPDNAEEYETATYLDPISSFNFIQPTVKVGGAPIDEGLVIHSFNLVIPIPLHTGRWGLGHGAVQLEPHGFSDTMLPTWELACEFSNKEMFDYYVNAEVKEIEVSFVGDEIKEGEGSKDTITFTAPAGKFVGTDPEVSGPDVLDQTASVEVYDDLSKPLVTVTTISVDTEL